MVYDISAFIHNHTIDMYFDVFSYKTGSHKKNFARTISIQFRSLER